MTEQEKRWWREAIDYASNNCNASNPDFYLLANSRYLHLLEIDAVVTRLAHLHTQKQVDELKRLCDV